MIYYARHIETGLIKIGTSKQPDIRVNNLSTQYGKMELLATELGGKALERLIHRKYKASNAYYERSREFFKPTENILKRISATHDINKYPFSSYHSKAIKSYEYLKSIDKDWRIKDWMWIAYCDKEKYEAIVQKDTYSIDSLSHFMKTYQKPLFWHMYILGITSNYNSSMPHDFEKTLYDIIYRIGGSNAYYLGTELRSPLYDDEIYKWVVNGSILVAA